MPYDDGYSVTNPLNPAPTEPHLGSGSSPENTPSNAKIYMPVAGMNEISSASVEVLTSTSLLPLRDLIAKAREQRAEIKADLQEALAEESKQKASWLDANQVYSVGFTNDASQNLRHYSPNPS